MTYETQTGARSARTIENPSVFQQAIFDWVANGQGNAMVTARAGSGKCVTGDTLVSTEAGFIRIRDATAQHRVWTHWVGDKPGFVYPDATYREEGVRTVRIQGASGTHLEGTVKHPVLVVGLEGRPEWRQLGEVREGDLLILSRTAGFGHGALEVEDAWALGVLVGDGNYPTSGYAVALSRNGDPRPRFEEWLERKFPGTPARTYLKGEVSASSSTRYRSEELCAQLVQWDFPQGNAPVKYVPSSVMAAPASAVAAFIRGLFDTDGHCSSTGVEWVTASRRLAEEVHVLLKGLGILGRLAPRVVPAYPDNEYWRMAITGSSLRQYAKVIGFTHREKAEALATVVETSSNSNVEVYPGLVPLLCELRASWINRGVFHGKSQRLHRDGEMVRVGHYFRSGLSFRAPSAQALRWLAQEAGGTEAAQLAQWYATETWFDPVVKITASVEATTVYDFTIEATRNFVANGTISHNTTTAVAALEFIPRGTTALFLAFNKSIAEEIKHRVPRNIDVKTYHGFGFMTLAKSLGKMLLEPSKLDGVVRQIVPEHHQRKAVAPVKKLVSLAKANLTRDVDVIFDLAEHHGMTVKDEGKFRDSIGKWVLPALDLCSEIGEQQNIIDFDDMCWLPIELGLDFPTFKFVMVDEVQDTNPVQSKLVENAVGNAGRILSIGDDFQSIYGWRSADVDAIPKMVEKFSMQTLSLPVTYRCPAKVVALAQQIVPDIQARPGAPDGIVEYPAYPDVAKLVRPGDMVLSRTVASLVEIFLEIVALGKPAVLRGRDLGKNLINLVERFEVQTIDALLQKLAQFREREITRHMKKKRIELAMRVVDDTEALEALSSGLATVDELVQRITRIFSDEVKGVVLSTIHRAKGLEADRVVILRPDLLPHPMAQQLWEIKQEMNLKYVAITRAVRELYIVQGPYPGRLDRYRQYGIERFRPESAAGLEVDHDAPAPAQ